MAIDVRHVDLALAPSLGLGRDDAPGAFRKRGWIVRRALLIADVLALLVAFAAAQAVTGDDGGNHLFLISLPAWILLAQAHGLYRTDDDRTDHSTGDEILGLFQFVTIGTWLFFLAAWLGAGVDLRGIALFWALALTLVPLARIPARAVSRRSAAYAQRALIVGAGDVGQLLARKIVQHPEYGIELVGFLDARPKDMRSDLGVPVLGAPDAARLIRIVRRQEIDRIIVAFSGDPHEELLENIRWLEGLGVRIDVVPRLFETVGADVVFDTVEGLPLVGVKPREISRTTLAVKRAIDLVVGSCLLVAVAPLLVYVAWRIKRDSPGPVFFRQTRFGRDMRPFTFLKFRTMHENADIEGHRAYIRSVMDVNALPQENGLFKLERPAEITSFGRWLRRTSLDELPQLINIVRGDMSLVGPRPCMPYEVEFFEPHHFERFRVPQGLTGLWQVTARAHSTFGEALEMDVAYARSFSLSLDLKILLRTPRQLLRGKGTR